MIFILTSFLTKIILKVCTLSRIINKSVDFQRDEIK